MPKVEWKSDQPVTGTATLSYGGPDPTTISGSGTLIGFRYTQIDGSHKVEPVSTADCRRYEIDPATPMNAPLSKSGALSPEDPDFDFLRSFLTAPDVRLPAGMWDVSALAQFTEGDCGPGGHSMAATVRVTVTDCSAVRRRSTYPYASRDEPRSHRRAPRDPLVGPRLYGLDP